MPALKWLRMLMNHTPDKYEHLVRYHGYYSNRSRGAGRLVGNGNGPAGPIRIDEPPADGRLKLTMCERRLLAARLNGTNLSADDPKRPGWSSYLD